MTSDSRVEAVARGLCKKGRNDPDKVVNNLFGPDPSKKVPLWTQYRGEAQAAIEANDAWLKERGWKAVPRDMTDPMRSANYSGPITSWQASWDRAPSPEDVDQ